MAELRRTWDYPPREAPMPMKCMWTVTVVMLGSIASVARANDAGSAPTAGASSCEAQVASYRKWIAGAPRLVFPVASPFVRLVEGSGRGPDWLAESESTEVRPSGVVHHGTRLGVAGWQARMLEEVQRGQHPADEPLALEIDRDAKWSLVSDVVTAAGAAGIRNVVILLARRYDIAAPPATPATTPPPKVPPSSGDLRWEQTQRVNARVEMLARALRPCSPAAEALPQLAGMSPEQKAMVFVDMLPAALLGCKCSVRPADTEALIFGTFDPDPDGSVRRPYVAATIQTSANKRAHVTVVRAPKDLVWSEAYRRVVDAAATGPGGRPMRLVADAK